MHAHWLLHPTVALWARVMSSYLQVFAAVPFRCILIGHRRYTMSKSQIRAVRIDRQEKAQRQGFLAHPESMPLSILTFQLTNTRLYKAWS